MKKLYPLRKLCVRGVPAIKKVCSYNLIDCMKLKKVEKCAEFPCDKISKMLKTMEEYENRCRKLCSGAEFAVLKEAFFEKEVNIRK